MSDTYFRLENGKQVAHISKNFLSRLQRITFTLFDLTSTQGQVRSLVAVSHNHQHPRPLEFQYIQRATVTGQGKPLAFNVSYQSKVTESKNDDFVKNTRNVKCCVEELCMSYFSLVA